MVPCVVIAFLIQVIIVLCTAEALLSAAEGMLARAIAARFTSKRAARATGESRMKRPHCVQLLAARPAQRRARPGSHPRS